MCMYVYVCVCVCVCMYVCMYVCMCDYIALLALQGQHIHVFRTQVERPLGRALQTTMLAIQGNISEVKDLTWHPVHHPH